MRHASIVLAIGVGALVAGCASDPNRQWMKIGQPYTVEEFRRDYAECTVKGRLDDACMRNRGWVDVRSAEKEKPAADPGERGRAPRGY